MQDAGIVRNRRRSRAPFCRRAPISTSWKRADGFSALLWDFLDGRPKVNRFEAPEQVPAETAAVARDVEGPRRRAASSSSARPSSMPSCRRSAWSTTISSPAIATRPVRARAQAGTDDGAAASVRLPAARPARHARLAAHAVGPPARPARSLAARYRDRGHRPRARAGGALERPDDRRAYLLGRAALAAGRDDRAPAAVRARPTGCGSRCCCTTRPNMSIGDMISPFKAVIGDSYKAVESRCSPPSIVRFGLPAKLPADAAELIKAADRGAAYLEATRLAGFTEAEARRFFGAPPKLSPAIERDYLTPWPAETAEARYLERFAKLCAIDTFPASAVSRAYILRRFGNALMIHVCSLARLYDTVAETGARHIVTLLKDVDRVGGRDARAANHLHPRHGRHRHPMDGYIHPAEQHVSRADRFRAAAGTARAAGGALLCRHQPLDRRRLHDCLRAQSDARRSQRSRARSVRSRRRHSPISVWSRWPTTCSAAGAA